MIQILISDGKAPQVEVQFRPNERRNTILGKAAEAAAAALRKLVEIQNELEESRVGVVLTRILRSQHPEVEEEKVSEVSEVAGTNEALQGQECTYVTDFPPGDPRRAPAFQIPSNITDAPPSEAPVVTTNVADGTDGIPASTGATIDGTGGIPASGLETQAPDKAPSSETTDTGKSDVTDTNAAPSAAEAPVTPVTPVTPATTE